MILAAGLGSRLKELTTDTPKCLMRAGGKTMLEHAIESLKQAGVNSVVINTHHHAEAVKQFVVANGNFGLTVHLSYEPNLLGTGGGLRNVESHFNTEDAFIVTNADVYCQANFIQFVAAHNASGALATLVVMERQETSYLLFDENSGQFVGWELSDSRKNTITQAPSPGVVRKAFCGIQVVSPKIFEYMKDSAQSFSIIDSYMHAKDKGEKIFPYTLSGEYWVDIGTPNTLKELLILPRFN